MLRLNEIQMRDPFVLPVPEQDRYFLYGTTDKNCWQGPAQGFDTYTSEDLQNWRGPFPVFRPEPDFWADQNFWAPEVYFYKNKYYLFASFKADNKCRGTQVLLSDSPKGPFIPNSKAPVTPPNWECLDGTLFVNENGIPWMIYCHEWVQTQNGRMYAIQLDSTLGRAVSDSILLFSASQAPWTRPHQKRACKEGFVTDGPFLYRSQNGELLMLWSSFGEKDYAIGIARSESGEIQGPWQHDPLPIYAKDGGHGMLFRTFEGQLMLTIHTPNDTPNERPIFIPMEESDGRLEVKTIE